jgi:hypothetical protein
MIGASYVKPPSLVPTMLATVRMVGIFIELPLPPAPAVQSTVVIEFQEVVPQR